MLDFWGMWAYRSPHQLQDTDPLPKFKGIPSSARIRPYSASELEWHKANHLLSGLLNEHEDLNPVLSYRGRRKSFSRDLWSVGREKETADDLIGEVLERTAQDESAIITSNLAQAAVKTLPLIMLAGQLYYHAGSVWEPMDRSAFVLAYEEDPRIKAALQGINLRGLSDLYERVRLQSSIQRDLDDVKMPPDLIPCRDGVFDLAEMHPRKIRPDDYFFSCCNIGAEEIGKGTGAQFERFIASVSDGRPAIRQQILELIGVVISGYRPKNFFLLLGPRDTGKSQLMNLLRTLVGDRCTQSISNPNELSGQWMSGSLVGKRLCYCPDAARVTLSQKSAAALKQLTGGDLIQANVKYKQPFTFRNESTIVFVSNHPLTMPWDEALESRLITIPFFNSIPRERQIPNFSELLYRERGYIVGEAIRALKALVNRGFMFSCSGDVPPYAHEQNFGSAADQVSEFVEQCCRFDSESKEYTDTLYTAFCEFLSESGGSSLSRETFSKELSGLFQELEPFRTSRQRGYRGIRLIK